MKPVSKQTVSQKNHVAATRPADNLDAWVWPVSETVFLIGLFVVAWLAKLICLGQYATSPDFAYPVGDAETYLNQARAILSTGKWLGDTVPFQTPLYPMFVAVCLAMSKQSVFFVRLVQITLGAGQCVLIYLLAKKWYPNTRWVASLAGVLTLGYGLLTFFEIDLLGISLALFMSSVTLLSLIRAQQTGKVRWAGLAGVAFGLAVLERANLLLFLPVALWYLASRFSLDFKTMKNWAWKPTLVFFVGSILMILPVTVHNARVSGDFVLLTSNAGVNMFLGNNPKAQGVFYVPEETGLTNFGMDASMVTVAEKELGRSLKPSEVSRFWSRKAWVFWLEQPGAALRLYGEKLRMLMSREEPPNHLSYEFMRRQMVTFLGWLFVDFGWIAPLAALGLYFQIRKGLTATTWLLVGYLVALILSLLPFFITDRYRLPLVPILILFAALGIVETLRLVLARQWKDLGWAGLVWGVTLWLVLSPTGQRFSFAHTRTMLAGRLVDRSYREPKAGNPDMIKAILEFKQALEESPRHIPAHLRLAGVYQAIGCFNGALRLAEKVERISGPGSADTVKTNARNALTHAGSDAVAETALPQTLFEQALAAEAAGDTRFAERHFRKILSQNPYHVPAYEHLGNLYLKRGEKAMAVDVLRDGVRRNPGVVPLLDALAEAAFQNGNIAEATRLKTQAEQARQKNE